MKENDLIQADCIELFEPMATMLKEHGPKRTLDWLANLLEQQRPALRSSSSKLVAYTGCSEAIDWLEFNVSSPVTTHWGEGAALLGAPWGRIKKWLELDRNHQIMALDALYVFRFPAPNMAPLEQMAAPVLADMPSLQEFEASLNNAMSDGGNPRMRLTIERIMDHVSEILSPRERGVSVRDLPKLFLDPESFQNSAEILIRHEKVLSGMRGSINKILKGL